MDTSRQPGITFDNVFLKELSFSRQNSVLKQNSSLDIDFDYRVSLSEDKKQIACELACKVSEKNNLFNMHCEMCGIFSVDEDHQNMDIQEFAGKNAPSHLFPFIREMIATTSVKAGMPPIILPPTNIVAILNASKENLKSTDTN